ncbi:MAG TPA: cyanophycinase [Thermoanaerobaculia bacterium]
MPRPGREHNKWKRNLALALLFPPLVAFALSPSARGRLLIVGGGPIPDEILDRFVELAGGRDARIAIFPQASSSPDAGVELAEDFEKRGARAKRLLVTREDANREDAASRLSGITGVWFGGGDQTKLTAVLAGTRLERAIHALYEKGAVVGGTSAGAAVMSALMLTGDERYPGGSRPSSDDSGASITIAQGNVVLEEGFGFLSGAIVDQHFVRRRRHNRLISAVLESPERLGIGIDESTAVEVDPEGCWTVRGESVAVVYDARRAEVSVAVDGRLEAAGIRMHVIPVGGFFDPWTGRAHLPASLH